MTDLEISLHFLVAPVMKQDLITTFKGTEKGSLIEYDELQPVSCASILLDYVLDAKSSLIVYVSFLKEFYS